MLPRAEASDGFVGVVSCLERRASMAVVLVTGCRTGIGYETALAFGRRGDRVYATMRDPSGGVRLAQQARQESLAIVIDKLDVTDPMSAKEAVDSVFAEEGTLDVLV